MPVLDEYWRLLESIDPPGGSNRAKAVAYSLNQKNHLQNVLLDGWLELTNNRAERAVKPFVIGRKCNTPSWCEFISNSLQHKANLSLLITLNSYLKKYNSVKSRLKKCFRGVKICRKIYM